MPGAQRYDTLEAVLERRRSARLRDPRGGRSSTPSSMDGSSFSLPALRFTMV